MLITCPECGNKVSSSAYSCRKCGYKEYVPTWSAGTSGCWKMSANMWSKTIFEANSKLRKALEDNAKRSAEYKTPKQEEREWRDEQEREFNKKAKAILLGGLVIVAIIILLVLSRC